MRRSKLIFWRCPPWWIFYFLSTCCISHTRVKQFSSHMNWSCVYKRKGRAYRKIRSEKSLNQRYGLLTQIFFEATLWVPRPSLWKLPSSPIWAWPFYRSNQDPVSLSLWLTEPWDRAYPSRVTSMARAFEPEPGLVLPLIKQARSFSVKHPLSHYFSPKLRNVDFSRFLWFKFFEMVTSRDLVTTFGNWKLFRRISE